MKTLCESELEKKKSLDSGNVTVEKRKKKVSILIFFFIQRIDDYVQYCIISKRLIRKELKN